MDTPEAPAARNPGRPGEVFVAFLRLGLVSFGGPLAHVAYFHQAFVQRRRWLDDAAFAQLLSLCQALPGPTSSQLGFALGHHRAGWAGALAAFAGFTLPSAVLMFLLAQHLPWLTQAPAGQAVLHGLKLVAVVVVTQGVWVMARQLLRSPLHWLLAAAAAAIVLAGTSPGWQLLAIAVGAAGGAALPVAPTTPTAAPRAARPGKPVWPALLLFVAILALTLIAGSSPSLAHVAAASWRAGALVFGGGHVVLPLLEAPFVGHGWMPAERFLAGYGAAQAMPGPMFSVGAYLGASVAGVSPWMGALAGLLGLFAPGFLLLVAVLPLWQAWLADPRRAGMVAGINAAALGLLAAALCNPLWPQAVADLGDVAIVAMGVALLIPLRRHALWAVAWCVGAVLVRMLVAAS